jgi:hypothetical protein
MRGVFGESEPAELIEGVVLKKYRPMSPRECFPQDAFLDLIGRTDPFGWHVWIGTAVTQADSEPEPDVAFLRGDTTVFRTRFAGPSEVGLIVEFADASLRFDREVKGRVYARAGIPVYWIMNVADGQVEVYTDPRRPRTAPAPTTTPATACRSCSTGRRSPPSPSPTSSPSRGSSGMVPARLGAGRAAGTAVRARARRAGGAVPSRAPPADVERPAGPPARTGVPGSGRSGTSR